MFREELPKGTGMLFIYPKPTIVELWMKNTSLPLSAAFIDKDFFITEIIKMEELYSTRIYRSRNQAKYCIEVPLGWFEENGVAPGDMLVIPEGSVLE